MVKNPVPLSIGGFVGGGLSGFAIIEGRDLRLYENEAELIYFLAQPHFTQPHRGLFYSELFYCEFCYSIADLNDVEARGYCDCCT